MKPAATLRLRADLEGAIGSGHPWIYRDALPKHRLATGDWVRLEAGSAHAYGLFDADGAIGVRLLSRRELPDREWVRARVNEAVSLRSPLSEDPGTDCYRLLNGEGDGLPGLVADRYGRFLVMKVYSESMRTILPEVVQALASALQPRGIAERGSGDDLHALYGQLPPPELTVRENGLRLIANPYRGQKTGLFLDQRDNRAKVRTTSGGRSVLNLFSYNGGFSVYALAGGAREVLSVDIAPAALADAERAVAANEFPPEAHRTLAADVFDYLSDGEKEESFDLVICDPPSLAHAKKSRHSAGRAYRRLNRLAMKRVSPGGLLATSSCTAQVSPDAFREAVRDAATEAGVRAQIVYEAGQPLDHPVPAHFPEGRYLKFMLLRVLPGA